MDLRQGFCTCLFIFTLDFEGTSTAKLPEVNIKNIRFLSTREVLLSWRTSYDVKRGQLKYLVRYKIKGGKYNSYRRIPTAKAEVVLRGLALNTVYTVAVRALKGRTRGAWSESLDFTTPVATAIVNNEPTIEGNVSFTDVGQNYAAIKWKLTSTSKAVVELLEGFLVTWKDGTEKHEKETTHFNISLTGLEPGHKYSVNVYFLKIPGGKVKIGTLKFQTKEEGMSAPRNLRLKSLTDKEAIIKWRFLTSNDPDIHVNNYVIQYKRRGGGSANMCRIKIDNSTRSFTIKGLLADTKYAIRVAGKYNNATGQFTDWLRVRTEPEMLNKTDVRVYHVSPTEVLLLWKPFNAEVQLSLDLYAISSSGAKEFVRDHTFEMFEPLFLDELLPDQRYRTEVQERDTSNCTMYRAVEFSTQSVDCPDDCPRVSHQSGDYDLPLLSQYYESALRIIPITSNRHVITWTPFDYFPNNLTFMYVLRILGEPFLYPLATHLILNGSTHHVIKNMDRNKTFSMHLLVFEKNEQFPVFSSYHLIVHPAKDIPMTDTRVSRTEPLPWTATSMDILVTMSQSQNISGDILQQTIADTDLVLVSKMFPDDSDVLTLMYNSTHQGLGLDHWHQEVPVVDIIRNQTAREGTTIYVTCLARGDPYPIVSWINKTADEAMSERGRNDTERISITASRYVGSSSMIDGTAFLGMKRFLSIGPVQLWDEGVYACLAENTAGEDQAVFILTVIPKPPGPVINLIARSPTPFEIYVKWTPPEEDELVPDESRVHGYRVQLLDEYDVILGEKTVNKPGTAFLDVEPSTLYKLLVSAYNEKDEGIQMIASISTTGIPQLGPPLNVSVTTYNGTTLMVSWSPPSVVKSGNVKLRTYLFHQRKFEDRKSEEMQLPNNITTVSVNDLDRDQRYEVQVIALSEDGQVSASVWSHGSTFREQYMNESRPPPPPLNVYLRAESGNIIVSWLPPFPDENVLVRAYEILVFNNGTKREVMKVGYKESSVIVYEVEMGVHYRISVKAVNNAGPSIEEAQELYIPMEQVSERPVQHFRGVALSSSQLELRWDPPPHGLYTHYVLSYTLSGVEAPELPGGGILPKDVTQYIVRSLKPYTVYLFTITPFLKRIRGTAANSTVMSLSDRPTGPPTNVTITPVNATTVLMTCAPPKTGKNGVIITYKISYRTKYTWRSDIVVEATDNQELLEYITGLIHSTVYEFRVRALTVNGSGPWSTWLQTKTPVPAPVKPKVPRNLQASSTWSAISVRWEPPEQDISYITGYVVGWGQFLPEVYRESVNRDKESYVIEGLDPDTVYIVSVRSFNEYGESVAIFELTKTGLS